MTTDAVPGSRSDAVRAIARDLGVPEREVSVAPRQGQVNLTIFLGNDLVLRLPRREDFVERLSKEAEVLPLVRDRGIPTAELIRFDSSHTIAEVTYMVVERLHGREIEEMPSPVDAGDPTYRSLCEILSSLHSLHRDSEPSIAGVQTAEFSTEALLDQLTGCGEIGGNQAAWLRRWFDLLEAQGARSSAPALLHGDVMPSNLILNGSGDVTAIIDWGSACWGEPARDLAGFRTSVLPAVTDVYREVAGSRAASGGGGVGPFEASALWYQLFFALARLGGRQSTSEARNWSAPRGARLLEVMRFLTTDAPRGWRRLLPGE